MNSVKKEIADWIKGYQFGFTTKDKLILLLCITNTIIVLTILYAVFGKEKTGKIAMSNPTLLNWIPAKRIMIKRDDILMSIPNAIDYTVFVKLDWEIEEKEFALKSSKNNGVILDIGSNGGYYTLMLANKYNKSKIISIEASPSIFEILDYNCKLNQFSNIILHNCAITNKDHDEINFYTRDSMSTVDKETLIDWSVPENKIKNEKTKTITIDTLLENENLDNIVFCKIDIEGAEKMALEGAENTLKKRLIQKFMIEYHSFSNRDFVVKMLKNEGYDVTVKERDVLYKNKDYANGHIYAQIT